NFNIILVFWYIVKIDRVVLFRLVPTSIPYSSAILHEKKANAIFHQKPLTQAYQHYISFLKKWSTQII
ncbi:hypothetical protein BpHYR1_021235, partial [Brachionus plicatilis]